MTTRDRLRVLITACALGAPALNAIPRVAHAQASNEAIAQMRFQHGRDLFNAGHWTEALTEFRATVALVSSPNTRLYIARCLHHLDRNADAILEYQHAAAEAADRAANETRYAATRDAARTEAAALEPLVGHLTIHVDGAIEGLVVTADGNPVPAGLLDVRAPMDPRGVAIVARAPGRTAFEQTVTVEAGGDAEVTVQLPLAPVTASSSPPPAEPRVVTVREGGTLRIVGIVVGGVGLAGGVIGTAVFGSMAQSQFSALQRVCNAPCPELQSQINDGERDRLLTNVSIGVGAGLLIAGVVMIVVGGPHDVQRGEAARSARAAIRLLPWGAPLSTGGVAGIGATF